MSPSPDGRPALLAAALLLAGGAPVGARDLALPAAAAWSYDGATGPDRWADLSPAFAACREGRQQSPIDIRAVQVVHCEPLQFLYHTQTLDAVNDGRGVHVLSPPGSTLRVQWETYGLTAFHFHSPGETLINGVAAAAEIHLVHRSADGRHAVVVVPIQPGPHVNSTLARIVERLPLRAGEQVSYRQVGVNPLLMLPSDKDYYAYSGSLANPPCSEPVAWFILARPVELDPGQISRIAQAAGANRGRPVQPLNGRTVYACRRR